MIEKDKISCKYCKNSLIPDTECSLYVKGNDDLSGWYCNDNCFELFEENWAAERNRRMPV